MALGHIYLRFAWQAWHLVTHRRFAWQAWHLWHWAGSGGALGPVLVNIFHAPYLSHTIFHTPLCHTQSWAHHFVTRHFTHHFVTHHLSHTIFHTPLCHTQSWAHHLSHTTLSHTIFATHHLSDTMFHTQLCHTPSFNTPSFPHNFVTHHLSHTTLSHTIFRTQLCHTPSFTHNFHTLDKIGSLKRSIRN